MEELREVLWLAVSLLALSVLVVHIAEALTVDGKAERSLWLRDVERETWRALLPEASPGQTGPESSVIPVRFRPAELPASGPGRFRLSRTGSGRRPGL